MSNRHEWNVKLQNPPTRKRRDDVSRGNFGVDATPKVCKDKFKVS